MDDEKGKFQYSALKFVFDMELIDDPQLINHVKLNIFNVSNRIKEVELLSSYHRKSMLIFVDLTWFGKTFLKNRIEVAILDRVQQMLPNFRFRVVFDRAIFDLALKKVKLALTGGTNEAKSIDSVGAAGTDPSSSKT